MLLERTVNATIVLLVGAIQYAIPTLTRPDLFFAVTVQPDFRRTAEGRSIQRSYRIAVAIHTLIVGAGRNCLGAHRDSHCVSHGSKARDASRRDAVDGARSVAGA
jgi:hypothetical protein